ncbi:hypothetical protein RKE29_17430 [Streptomyces sp. B1866]|uniref:hypothetical protein n=1 Tax=Streptomyces sp. B1866 TaxID=3075431 RepID=UPI00288D2C37|nr:hypothetical protein [Streptomyces sp. B1866]MDT3398408.1 hypothetical protein [Streptomyces sp. B1866]
MPQALSTTTLYLARRDAYAAFLTAADAESHAAHHRHEGRYPDAREAVDAIDRAYAATRAAFNVIDVEAAGPVKEGRVVLERLRELDRGDGGQRDWYAYKKAREDFLAAAGAHLRELLAAAG